MSPRPAAVLVGIVGLAIVIAGGALLARGPGGPFGGSASLSPTPSRSAAPTASPTAGSSASPTGAVSGAAARLAACAPLGDEDARLACYATALSDLVIPADDPRPIVAEIADAAWAAGGSFLSDCHGLMHTVAREYATAHGLTLADLIDVLPANNDPGCVAGFSHGLVAGLAQQIDLSDPATAAAVCDAAGSRYQAYSCIHGFGHAFMRLLDEDLEAAIGLCTVLGDRVAPDCAQGAFHDYWFAVVGADGLTAPAGAITDPRQLCAGRPEALARGCWYRAFIETRPPGFAVSVPEQFDQLCADLEVVQRSACVTAASVIGPADPALQLALCARLRPADAASCVRGTKVQNLLHEPPAALVDLIERCAAFDAATAVVCYGWLGKVTAVLTDGAFERDGCPRLATVEARDACVAGARAMDEALITFS